MASVPRSRSRGAVARAAVACGVVVGVLAACSDEQSAPPVPATSAPDDHGGTGMTGSGAGAGSSSTTASTTTTPTGASTTPGSQPARPLPLGPTLAVPMPPALVEQRREWWLGEQLAITTGPDGSAYVFFTTLLDPSTDDSQVSFTRWNPRAAAWTAPVEVLRGAQVRAIGGLSIGAATDDVTGRVGVVWERQGATGASTGTELAWSDDAGANWEHHTIDRPAAMPRLALHDGKAYIAFRALTGMVIASSTAPGREEAWNVTPIPENGTRRPTATPPVLGFDADHRPVLTFQTVETDQPTRWLTTWRANPTRDVPNPLDRPVASDDEAIAWLTQAAAHIGDSAWQDVTVAAPGDACTVQLSLTSGDGRIENCPFGQTRNQPGPTVAFTTVADPTAAVGTPTRELAVVATLYGPSTGARTRADLPSGIYVWNGEPGPQWAPAAP